MTNKPIQGSRVSTASSFRGIPGLLLDELLMSAFAEAWNYLCWLVTHYLIHLWLLCFSRPEAPTLFSSRPSSQQPILWKKQRCSWCDEQWLCEDREPFSFIHGCLTLNCAPGSFRLQLAHPSCQPSVKSVFNWSKNYWWHTCSNSSRIQRQSASLNDKEIIVWSDCPRLLRMSASQLDIIVTLKKERCNRS